LAFSEPEQQAALIRGVELEPFTPNTITEVEDLERELATIRSHVIAHDRAEYDPSTECVAAPIFDRGGRIRAALSVISPTGAVSFSTRRGIEKDLVVSGEAISRGLLWVGAYPPP
jgi:IclR family acetate operon transcriptional repressor